MNANALHVTITKTTRRAAGAGTWVIGRAGEFHFEALLFPEHADCPDWEIEESRISKLFVRRRADRAVMFSWDRGADVSAANEAVQTVVDFLANNLADYIYRDYEMR